MPRGADILKVKQMVIERLELEVEEKNIVCANQIGGRTYRFWNDSTKCDVIDQEREYTMLYEVPNSQDKNL